MQSKRGNGRARRPNANKRPAGSAPSSGRRTTRRAVNRRQPRGRGLGSGLSGIAGTNRVARTLAAPIATGVIHSRLMGLKFPPSTPHDEFPEGGLRIVGTLPYNGVTFFNDTVLFGIADAAGLAAIAVNPCSAIVTATTAPLFAATSPLCVFAQYFRKYRFRKLALEWTSKVMPGVTTAATGAGLVVQITYENDIVTAEQLSGTYTISTSVQARNCTRFNVWANDVLCPIIEQKQSTKSDELFFISTAGDSQSAANDAALRQTHQGAIVATCDTLNPTADLAIGDVLVHFDVDLYGFANAATGLLPQRLPRKSAVEAKYHSVEEPDAVFVNASNQVRVRSDVIDVPNLATPGAQKSQSLKGSR